LIAAAARLSGRGACTPRSARHGDDVTRIGCVLLIVLAVMAAAVSATSYAGAGSSGSGAATVVVPALDLSGIFGGGSENEPDENEPNEKGPNGQPATPIQGHGHSGSSSSAPLQIVLPAIGVSLVLIVAAIVLVVRWVRRYRAWKRRVTFRARARIRRMGDDLDRARERLRP
jgi:hypothetical protein